jgi:hypothetical protein
MATAVSQFDRKTLSFPGNKLQQAQFLLRQVLPLGNVAKSLATIPPALAGMLDGSVPAPQTLKAALRRGITAPELDEAKHLGGEPRRAAFESRHEAGIVLRNSRHELTHFRFRRELSTQHQRCQLEGKRPWS